MIKQCKTHHIIDVLKSTKLRSFFTYIFSRFRDISNLRD